MAVQSFDVTSLSSDATVVTWDAGATGDTGAVYLNSTGATRGCVQFRGTFAGGTVIVLQGSNDGTTWYTLDDTQTVAVSATAAAIFEFDSAARYLRPSIGSGAADSVSAIMVIRGT